MRDRFRRAEDIPSWKHPQSKRITGEVSVPLRRRLVRTSAVAWPGPWRPRAGRRTDYPGLKEGALRWAMSGKSIAGCPGVEHPHQLVQRPTSKCVMAWEI